MDRGLVVLWLVAPLPPIGPIDRGIVVLWIMAPLLWSHGSSFVGGALPCHSWGIQNVMLLDLLLQKALKEPTHTMLGGGLWNWGQAGPILCLGGGGFPLVELWMAFWAHGPGLPLLPPVELWLAMWACGPGS